MLGEHGTQLVVTSNGLDHTRSEDLLRELDDLQGGVRGEWRRLDDNGVSGEQGWNGFADGQNDWEVPWADLSLMSM